MQEINPTSKYERNFKKLGGNIQTRVVKAIEELKSFDGPLSMGVRKSGPVEGYFPVWSYEIGDQQAYI